MAKTESTAVNELIDKLAAGQEPPAKQEEDLLFSPPKPSKPSAPRMTATIPPMRAAGEVAPLPRRRTPNGTSQNNVTRHGMPVRVTTAPPSRQTTIPPLGKVTVPALPPLPPRASRPGLPAPNRGTLPPNANPAMTLQGVAPVIREARPLSAPVVARRRSVDLTGDAVSAEGWFEPSRTVDKVDKVDEWSGTQPVYKMRGTLALLRKLAVPIVIALVVGAAFGGFLVFNGEGGKKRHVEAPKPAPKQVALAEPAAPMPSTESANAATATAGGEQPQPPAKDTGSVIPAATAAALAANPPAAKTDTAKIDFARAAKEPEPAKTEPAKTEPAKVEPAKVAAAAALGETPAITEVKTSRGVVKLADVRIDSRPEGATVMLVDNGKTSFLGTTPVAASLDPSRAYDVVFTLEGRPTQMAHVDPAHTRHVEVALGKTGTPAKATPAVATAPAPAPTHHHHDHDVAKVAAPDVAAEPAPEKKAEPAPEKKAEPAPAAEKKIETAPAPASAAKAAAGNGTLMISSKPPCEIIIDGTSTGLITPQRSIPLAAGPHKITLVHAGDNLKKTVSVSIQANQATKVIQDLMKK